MFQIPVWDLLASYTGDSQELAFDGPVYEGYYDDLTFLSNLKLKIRLIAIDEGIELLLSELQASVQFEWMPHTVEFIASETVEPIARRFVTEYDPLLPDDIGIVDVKNSTIDLKNIIREEILLQIMQY